MLDHITFYFTPISQLYDHFPMYSNTVLQLPGHKKWTDFNTKNRPFSEHKKWNYFKNNKEKKNCSSLHNKPYHMV